VLVCHGHSYLLGNTDRQFLHKFGSPDDVIEAVTTVREYLPHYVIVSVRCSADTQPGSQSQSTVLAALTDFATYVAREVR